MRLIKRCLKSFQFLRLLTELYDFLNTTRKRKTAVCDSDFSNLVLTVYKLTRNNLHSGVADVVHSPNPQHLVFRFDRFRYVFLFGEFFYQPREHFLCLPVNVGKITVQLAACQQNVATYPVILDTTNAAVPIRRYTPFFLRAVSGREDRNHPAIHTKARFSRYKCICPFCNPPIGSILPTIQSFRPITKTKGRGLPYEASPLGQSLFFM